MKKMMLSLLMSVGVGLTLMASPAQVCDDNNAVAAHDGTAVQAETGNTNHAKAMIKHEWKVKNVDFTRQNGTKLMSIFIDVKDPELTLQKITSLISDPVGPPVIIPNAPFPKPDNVKDKKPYTPGSSDPIDVPPINPIRPGGVNPEISTFVGSSVDISRSIIDDPIDDPGLGQNSFRPNGFTLLDK